MEVTVNDTNFNDEVLESGVPVLVDFWAEWCGPCLMVAPALKEIAKEYEGKLKVCKLNVDGSPNTATKYEIMSIPTLMVFKNGKAVDKVVGALPKFELENTIKKYI